MSVLTKVFQQTGWQLLTKVVSSFSSILILAAVSRKFGESGTGVFTLALTFLSFLSLVVDFGINAHIVRDFLPGSGRQKNEIELIWRKLLGFRVVLSVILMVFSLVAIAAWPESSGLFKLAVVLGLFSVFVSVIYNNANVLFQGKLRYDLAFLANGGGSLVSLGAVFLIVSSQTEVSWLMLGYDVGWLITGVLSLLLIRPYIKNFLPIFDWGYYRQLLKDVWPISLTLVLNVVYFRADSFLLSIYKTYSQVGEYNLAYQIFQSALVFPSFIMNSYYPIMLGAIERDRPLFLNHLRLSVLGMLGIAILGTLVTFGLSGLIVSLVAGNHGFNDSAKLLSILSFSFPAFFLSSILMWTLVTLKKYKTMVCIYLLGLIFNVTANIIFIPSYSYFGVAVVTVVSEYLILFMLVFMIVTSLKSRE